MADVTRTRPGAPAVPMARVARIQVVTAEGCPFCAAAVREVEHLARDRPGVTVDIIDAAAASDLLARHHIAAVPAVVIDDELALVGRITAAKLAEALTAPLSIARFAEELRTMLEEKRLAEVIALLRSRAPAAQAAISLLRGGLGERIAVLLALREAHAAEPGCLCELVPPLLGLLGSDDANLRGDVADLLGTLGDPRARSPLTALLTDPDAEVREAAADAIAHLER